MLVLPIEHFPSALALSPSAFAEIERYLAALRACFAAQARLHMSCLYVLVRTLGAPPARRLRWSRFKANAYLISFGTAHSGGLFALTGT